MKQLEIKSHLQGVNLQCSKPHFMYTERSYEVMLIIGPAYYGDYYVQQKMVGIVLRSTEKTAGKNIQ